MSERRALGFLSLALSAGVAVGLVVLWQNGVTQRDDKEQAQLELVRSAETIKAACGKDPATVRALLGADACTKAREIVDRPPAEKGDTGARGAQGEKGPKGDKGDQGAPGKPGEPGANGQAPGCLILVSKCQGSQGPRGIQGLTGARGADGEPGADGAAGVDGKDGAPGADGAPGKDGAPGRDGPPGQPGPAGPTCPAGSSLQQQRVVTTETPTGVVMLVCVADNQPAQEKR